MNLGGKTTRKNLAGSAKKSTNEISRSAGLVLPGTSGLEWNSTEIIVLSINPLFTMEGVSDNEELDKNDVPGWFETLALAECDIGSDESDLRERAVQRAWEHVCDLPSNMQRMLHLQSLASSAMLVCKNQATELQVRVLAWLGFLCTMR